MKKCMLSILVSLASSLSLAQAKSGFLVNAVEYFCYQKEEIAYRQALTSLQMRADNICRYGEAIRLTEIFQENHGCAVNVQAYFTCEN